MILKPNVSLKPYNTFGIEANAAYFSEFSTEAELQELLNTDVVQKGPLLVLGGGSNILLTQNFPGVAVRNNLKGIAIVREEGDEVIVRASAGEIWHEFVSFCISHQLGGIENLSLIPGSVGAAPMQNIGAYGVEVKDVFEELEALSLVDGSKKIFKAVDCKFGYRESVFKNEQRGKYIILSVTLRLSKRHKPKTSYGAIGQKLTESGIREPTIRDISNAVIAIRQSKLPDPAKIGNAGSFFKNPVVSKSNFEKLQTEYADIVSYPVDEKSVKLAAGWLIEKAGWKGKNFGNYGVHKNQALVLVNYGGAAGSDIYGLSSEILMSVKEKFGVELEREVNVV